MSISARDLGEEIGVTGATISNILSGRIIKPQGETCKKLLGYCQQYGIDTSELDWNEILDRAGISIGYCDECKSAVMNTKAGRCAGSKTISLDIGEPEYMSFSNGQDGFVIYLNLNVICNKPMTLELHESLLYTNGRQWARDFNYTGYGFEKETVEPGKPRKIGWIWINEKWPNKKLIEEEGGLIFAVSFSNQIQRAKQETSEIHEN